MLIPVVDDMVEKVECRKYDQALFAALRALVTIYGDSAD